MTPIFRLVKDWQ